MEEEATSSLSTSYVNFYIITRSAFCQPKTLPVPLPGVGKWSILLVQILDKKRTMPMEEPIEQ